MYVPCSCVRIVFSILYDSVTPGKKASYFLSLCFFFVFAIDRSIEEDTLLLLFSKYISPTSFPTTRHLSTIPEGLRNLPLLSHGVEEVSSDFFLLSSTYVERILIEEYLL